MISHRNVIANTLQCAISDLRLTEHMRQQRGPDYNEVVLGLLPFSHIYGLVAVVHAAVYRGSKVVVLPKFEMKSYLQAIQDHKIEILYIVSKRLFFYQSISFLTVYFNNRRRGLSGLRLSPRQKNLRKTDPMTLE